MVDNATDEVAPLADADESPMIPPDGDGNGVDNGGTCSSAQGGGALGRRQNAGPIMQRKDGVETTLKDEDDGEQ